MGGAVGILQIPALPFISDSDPIYQLIKYDSWLMKGTSSVVLFILTYHYNCCTTNIALYCVLFVWYLVNSLRCITKSLLSKDYYAISIMTRSFNSLMSWAMGIGISGSTMLFICCVNGSVRFANMLPFGVYINLPLGVAIHAFIVGLVVAYTGTIHQLSQQFIHRYSTGADNGPIKVRKRIAKSFHPIRVRMGIFRISKISLFFLYYYWTEQSISALLAFR